MSSITRRGFIHVAGTGVAAIAYGGNALDSLAKESQRSSAGAMDVTSDAAVSGPFGKALNAAWSGGESAQAMPAYKAFPLTVEFWCKLDPDPVTYNFTWTHTMLVANEPRESADHWAIFLDILKTGTPPTAVPGTLSAYLPGMTPDVIKSSKVVADGTWHYVAMVIDGNSVALYVDAEQVVKTAVVKKAGGTVIPGKLTVGKANLSVGGSMDFNGAIDDLRLSSVAREIISVPTAALQVDDKTIGLWNFDVLEDRTFADSSVNTNPIQLSRANSLNEIDRARYKAGPSPLDSPAKMVSLRVGAASIPGVAVDFSLDGQWQLTEGVTADANKQMMATVPGSVHTALYEAGLIPFPHEGRNQDSVAQWSNKTYWYQKNFSRPPAGQDRVLVFNGICNRCTIWLNGKELGRHEGMFTRVELPIHDLLQDSNTLTVKLEPAIPWKQTLVPNIFYGPFYTRIPPLGIWRSVEIRGEPSITISNPFIATRDAKTGLMDLVVALSGPQGHRSGELVGVISPENFQGPSHSFDFAVASQADDQEIHLQFKIPQPQLWWPVDMGKPNLYRLTLAFLPTSGGTPDVKQTTFGIRTVHMAPVNGQPRPRWNNWTFIVNGKPMFVKGSNWCTPDAMLDFSRARYERFLTLAARQHIQMLRVWGYGIVETDHFYDLCDRLGLMVMQEWPTSANSHNEQPLKLLEETVHENTLCLRNHPSLVIYTGGNESTLPFGPAIDMMGRLNTELDGTRAFHRSQPHGGSDNDYGERFGLDYAFQMKALFYGEVGFSYSYPNYESMQKLLPAGDKNLWPAPADGVFAYKTRVISSASDWKQMLQDSQYFTSGRTMRDFIIGTQLAQAVGTRHILERARTRWPDCTGALYFKFNEIAPTAERTSVDWFGSPKIPYYLIQDSFAPLLAVAVFSKATTHGEPLSLPIFLLDDADALRGNAWEVVVKAYNAKLRLIKSSKFTGRGSIKQVAQLGEFTLNAEQTKTAPLLVVTEVRRNRELAKRNYYFTNFALVKDCLFDLPKTTVGLRADGGRVIVSNDGELPAIGVHISYPGSTETFFAAENYFWLEPGEIKNVTVSTTEGVRVGAWNA